MFNLTKIQTKSKRQRYGSSALAIFNPGTMWPLSTQVTKTIEAKKIQKSFLNKYHMNLGPSRKQVKHSG